MGIQVACITWMVVSALSASGSPRVLSEACATRAVLTASARAAPARKPLIPDEEVPSHRLTRTPSKPFRAAIMVHCALGQLQRPF